MTMRTWLAVSVGIVVACGVSLGASPPVKNTVSPMARALQIGLVTADMEAILDGVPDNPCALATQTRHPLSCFSPATLDQFLGDLAILLARPAPRNPRVRPIAYQIQGGEAVTILPEAVRTGRSFGFAGDAVGATQVPAGPAGFYSISFPSSVWATTPGLMIDAKLERSLDGGATWIPFGEMGVYANPGQFGSPSESFGPDGAVTFASLDVSWDGQAMLLRGGYITTRNGVVRSFSNGVVLTQN